jgi:hypothetical protein
MIAMKKINIIFLLVAVFFAVSCFQDLGQDPAFNYPEGGGKTYEAKYGETLYMSFEADPYYVDSISLGNISAVGSPSFADGKIGKAYLGVADSYLKVEMADMESPFGTKFSAAFWYKRGAADRAGIITCGIATGNQKIGFVLFREGNTNFQILAGNGTTGVWGGAVALTEATTTDWVHMAFSIDESSMKLYCNGTLKKETVFAGPISWTDCSSISICSGAPTFNGWNHLSENGQIDELRFFNKTLTPEEVTTLMNLTQ